MVERIAKRKLWEIVKKGVEKHGYICSNPETKWEKLKTGSLCMSIGGVQVKVILLGQL